MMKTDFCNGKTKEFRFFYYVIMRLTDAGKNEHLQSKWKDTNLAG